MKDYGVKMMLHFVLFSVRKTSLLIIYFLLGTSLVFSQDLSKITGNVTDKNGEFLTGVTVVQQGTTNGAITDIDGNYEILSIPDDGVLIYSFIGMLTQEINVNSKRIINVVLEEGNINLEEIVAVGYGTQKKSDVTGAISQVKSEDMENRTIVRPEQALQGKTAGVQIIQTSGAPGKSSTVRVRGFSSNSGSDPLYVVDGLRTSDIGAIDPNNIESMEVLKDAASAAIYGAEAGNGVILITTKKGKKGGKITYDYQYVNNTLARIPDVLNANEYISYMTEANFITQDEISTLWDGTTDTDWADVAFESSVMKKHNLGFQGGNENGSFYMSFSYLDHNGIVKGDDDTYNRLTGMINADYKIKPWLKVGTTNTMEKWDMKSVSENSEYGSLLGAVLTMDPLTPDVYNVDEVPDFMQNLMDGGRIFLQNEVGQYYAVSRIFEADQIHPMIMRDRTDSENSGGNVLGTVYGDLTPFKGLKFTSKLGYRASFSNSYGFNYIYYANAIAKNSENISVSRTSSNNIYYQWENFANYNIVRENHNFTLLLGTSFSSNHNVTLSGSGNEITQNNPLFRDLDYLTASATKTLSGGYYNGRQFSYFGRLIYNYSNKYLFQASVRRDAGDLSILPTESRWGTFPAFSLGYVISQEDFFPKDIFISHMKLRASWGQNGSTGPLGGYAYRASIASDYTYPYTSEIAYQVGSAPTGLNNPELKWETSEQTDIGLDIRGFNDRLSFTFEYFDKKTKDLLVAITPPYETGVALTTVNAGNVSNKGFEFEFGWKDKIGDFSYSVRANLATLSNEVTYLDPSISRISGASNHTNTGITAFEVGLPVWYMRGYEVEDVDNETGDPVYVDQLTIDSNSDGEMDTADGMINDDDKTMIGSAIPDFTYGLTISASYKGFDMTLFGAGSEGNDIYNCMTRVDRPRGNKLSVFYDDRWTESNTDASRPRPNANGEDKYWMSNDVIFDGSFFKIKQMQLGYTLPKNLVSKALINSLRIYVSLDDWFVFTSYPGMDPEASAGSTSAMGVDKGSYPNSRKAVFGVNITF